MNEASTVNILLVYDVFKLKKKLNEKRKHQNVYVHIKVVLMIENKVSCMSKIVEKNLKEIFLFIYLSNLSY